MKVQTINMLSVLRNRPDIISVSALKVHFIYLCFSLNDRLLVISLVVISLGFTIRTVRTQFRIQFFLPNLAHS